MAPPFDATMYIRNLGIGILHWGPIRYHPFSLALDLLALSLDLFLHLYPYHSSYLILSPSRKNTDSHNRALDTSLELEPLHHTFLSTTFWGAMGNSCRMDKGCPFPYLFLVQNQTKNLFQILFLLPFFSPPFKFFHSLLHFFQIFRQSICHVR